MSNSVATIKTLLVTGGAGFIGSNFVRFLLRERPGLSIINLDKLSYSGNLENLKGIEGHPCYRFVRGDICDALLVAELLAEADAVVHMAAESHVDRSIMDAGPFIQANVVGTQTLLDAARRTWQGRAASGRPARFLYVSTDEVYGSLPLENPEVRFTEDSPILPNSPYAASKAAGDCLARAYHHTFGMDVVTTRCSNNFGPYQFPEKVIPLFVTNLLEGKQVPLYGDGLNVRDWIHVEDHCDAVLTVLEKGESGEVYNVGGNNERSNLDLTHAILSIMGMGKDMISPVADRLGHDRRYAIDGAKLARDLNWKPIRSEWPESLKKTVTWYQENQRWWKRVNSGEYTTYS